MKSKTRLAGIIALVAFIGFALMSCRNPLDDETVATPTANPEAGNYTLAQTVVLSCDTDGAKIFYTTNGANPTMGSALYSAPITINETATLKAIAVKDGMNNSEILEAVYTINNPQLQTVATPTASPAAGTYTSTQMVILSCDTGGASIYYTVNGANPTTSSALYSAPITISQTATLKAIAVKSNMNNSGILTAVYTINSAPPVGTPVNSWKGLTAPAKTTAKQHSDYQGKTDVLHVAPASDGYDWYALSYSLDPHTNQSITISVSMQVWLDVSTKVAWQVNVSSNDYPVIAGSITTPLSAGQWHTVEGTETIALTGTGKRLYLSSEQLDGKEIYITGLVITINGQVVNPGSGPNIETILHTKWPFKVGAAAPGSAFDSGNGQYPLLKQFEVLVAENDMKPDAVMPWGNSYTPPTSINDYRWTNADKLVAYAEANNTAIRGHVLIWHSQTPDYFFKTTSNALIDKTELYTRMETHIKTVFQKYGGRIGWWDVCNEVVAEGGGPRAPRPAGDNDTSKSYYTQIMQDAGLSGFNRYEYVLKAFQWARQYADANSGQNVKLYLTDYNTEYSGAKQTEFLGLLDYLITNNAPIDGVGFQCHIQYDWPSVDDISTAIDLVTAKIKGGKNLTAQVCELDMTLFRWDADSGKATLTTAEYDERIALQTVKYRALFEMFRQKYNDGKLDMALVWGLSDAHSWLNDRVNRTRVDYPLLFDRQYQPKAAYNELVR